MEMIQSEIPGLYKLKPSIQFYDWGGYEFLSHLTKFDNPDRLPMAELWYGDHQKAPAQLFIDGKWVELNQCITSKPGYFLGENSLLDSGHLPFLLKVLDVRSMLSIQAHPSRKQAKEGFALENLRKIPFTDPRRTFKDDNHKPELMVSLSDFWLLHGFKSLSDIKRLLHENIAFAGLEDWIPDISIKAIYQKIMTLDSDQVDERLNKLIAQIGSQTFRKDNPHFWANRAFKTYGNDRGIFSVYMLNLVKLTLGEAIFQDAGIPHAYLEGQNVEIMANSDNVFRGGLTKKHIDIPLLLSSLNFEPVHPNIQTPDQNKTSIQYPVPVPDFSLNQYSGLFETKVKLNTPAILLAIQGKIKITGPDKSTKVLLKSGSAFYLAPENLIYLKSTEESSLFIASCLA